MRHMHEGFGPGPGAGPGGRGRRGRGAPGGRGGSWGEPEEPGQAKFEEFAGPGWGGHGGPHGHGHGFGGPPWRAGRRMRRGDMRGALLLGLVDGPAHGYELIGRLETRTGGMWRPSAGSVYPTLQLLEDEGLVTSREEGGKRVFELTEDGRAEADAARERMGQGGPFGTTPAGPHFELRQAMKTLVLAARQVAVAGDDAQVSAAVAAVTDARQRIYRILAGDPAPQAGDTTEGSEPPAG